MSEPLKYTDVFVPGGYPKYTYNPREQLALEEKISSVLENLCKLAIVTGQTKSGKTVLVQKILPRDTTIWIDGGSVENEDDFWTQIIDQLQVPQTFEESKSSSRTKEFSSEASLEGNVFLAKGVGKIGGKSSEGSIEDVRQSRTLASKAAALSELRKRHIPLIIDDFHYLQKTLQGMLIRALKPLIFDGLPVVVIAIPHRRYDAVKVEREMTGRILSVNVPAWKKKELSYIPETGFPLLDKKIDDVIINRLTKESINSPHLMQEFCREICRYNSMKWHSFKSENVEKIFHETANSTIGRPIFEKLAQGPRQRSDRIQRRLKTGEKVDIYGLVLAGLAHIKPGLRTLEYEDLRTAIKEICIPENVPNAQEIARVLKRMAEIAATDQSSTPVIDFDEEEKRLHVTDPFFAFYLRWGDISK